MRITSWRGPGGKPLGRRSFSTAPQITSLSVARARIGATAAVTITGSNFRYCAKGDPPTVKFGNLFATNVVVVDQFTITCTSPIAVDPGTVDVTVTVGCCL